VDGGNAREADVATRNGLYAEHGVETIEPFFCRGVLPDVPAMLGQETISWLRNRILRRISATPLSSLSGCLRCYAVDDDMAPLENLPQKEYAAQFVFVPKIGNGGPSPSGE
jgi:hypothetical protein